MLSANGIWLNEGGIAHRQKLPQKLVAAFVLANVSGSLRIINDKLDRNEKYKIIKRLCNR